MLQTTLSIVDLSAASNPRRGSDQEGEHQGLENQRLLAFDCADFCHCFLG